ncbi:hypothetical protein [Mycobacterium decipiens]|uniref:hypothetical protein n=1 Tax=Mycobacterium decipiens TaxID=1430326 RepID=UPI001F61E76B|nr:hypothetical protein [Mycobacterium decipiens]
MPIRTTLAVVVGVLLVACIRLIVLLPETGVPAFPVALRLLVVEVDRAARECADRLALHPGA